LGRLLNEALQKRTQMNGLRVSLTQMWKRECEEAGERSRVSLCVSPLQQHQLDILDH
jgi:hypothetical protein